MDYIYLVGLLVVLLAIFYIVVLALADSDVVTFLAERYGKSPRDVYKGQVVWVTGASGGIGEALVLELAKCGAKLVLSARRESELERVKNKCLAYNSSLKSEDILVVPLDVTDLNSHEPSLKAVLDHFGKLDVLVSNAGRSQRGANWHEIDLAVDRDLFELNVFSVIHMNRLVVNHFRTHGGGHIVVVSSGAGKIGFPTAGSYSGSKHAIQGYFNTLRMENYGNNLDVTIICPGPVHSGIGENAFTSKAGESAGKSHATDRRMAAERCAVLSLVAMANRLNESWISLFPVIPVLYIATYFPLVASFFTRVVGRRMINKISMGTNKTD